MRIAFVIISILSLGLRGVCGGKPTVAVNGPDPVDFATQVRPVISSKCFQCHGQDESARKAKLRLDLRDEAMKDKDGKTPLVPGAPEKSEIIRRITTKDLDDVMPPPKSGHSLSGTEIETIRRWIAEGAKYTPHWAFKKPVRPELPSVRKAGWAKTSVDHFILKKLESAGLKPSPEADRYALIRRVTLDLTGLPPTIEETKNFVADRSSNAFEKVVERLLNSPAYGERWARVWLDLARYADSAGYGSDPLRLNIWPYRNWVIKALNDNMPFDRFTIEQLAGDLLPSPTQEQLVATAFHRNTMTNTEGGTDDEEFRVAAVKDRANVTMQVWMGLTMGCAQCHTHKYDPITHKEYYSFFALFNQTEDNDQPDEKPTLPLPTPEEKARMDKLKDEVAALEKQRKQVTPKLEEELAVWVARQTNGLPWQVIKPGEAQSASASTLRILDDGAVLASGISPEKDTYVVKAQLPVTNISAFRLELLPDPSMPRGGSGRGELGRSVINEMQISVRGTNAAIPKAKIVRIELPGVPRVLSLAEVQVMSHGTNIARQGKAIQSSVSQGAEASRAVDGITTGELAAGSVTMTASEDSPWWELDLGAEKEVEEIIIWNRTDKGLGTRLADFKVFGFDAARKEVWKKEISTAPNPVAFLRLPEEKSLKLKNASADLFEKDFEPRKLVDGDTDSKSGWSVGTNSTSPHSIAFEVETNSLMTPGAMLYFTLPQRYGTNQTVGKFRLSYVTEPAPVRIHPAETLASMLKPLDKQSKDEREKLMDYFREFAPSLAKANEELKTAKKKLDDAKPVAVPVMREVAADKRRVSHILARGNFLAPGDTVTPGVLTSFNRFPEGAPTNRLGAAQWLLSPDNPLTARVTVNRFWAQLFGRGLVETEEDFGTQGALPSHRELLDWLAVDFRESGWDVKHLLKTLVMSTTYQQSSRTTPEQLEKDPQNKLYSRGTRRRLDAETVRDQALELSGLLSHKIGGASVYPPQPDGLWRAAFNGERTWATSKGEDRFRRGLYTFWRRTIPYPSMAAFDAPSRESCTLRRIQTNTPLQAFVTLNDPAFVEAAQALGRRLVREGGKSPADRVRHGLRLVLGRVPASSEVSALVKLYKSELTHFTKEKDAAKKLATEPVGPLPPGMSEAEGAAWTTVGNVLLNLDGVLTKG